MEETDRTPMTSQLPPRKSGRATISDVAALAGVSPAAVSKVFNNTGRISESTSQRIRDAAQKLNWAPSAAAIALRKSRTQAIGLVLNSSSQFPDVGAANVGLISGIESILAPREYGLLLNIFITDTHEESTFYRNLAERQRMDGIILTDSQVGDTRFELVRQLGLPAVLIGTPWKPGVVEYVDADPPAPGFLNRCVIWSISVIGGSHTSVVRQSRCSPASDAMRSKTPLPRSG
ncbi:LacI family DNA-binding transcriptional regulator [Arthrobacter sp. JZ12]|nr:LacI family DNA-binding transcriptional regulator [Arthrobacter sp. JZ12]